MTQDVESVRNSEVHQFDPPLPVRAGPAPRTTSGIPHLQLDQFSPVGVQRALWERATALDHVRVGPSNTGPMTAEAFDLVPQFAGGRRDAFMSGWEFAHFHGDGSGSLHLTLPPIAGREAIEAGWAVRHPFAGDFLPATVVMVFGARDEAETETVWLIVKKSYLFARFG